MVKKMGGLYSMLSLVDAVVDSGQTDGGLCSQVHGGTHK